MYLLDFASASFNPGDGVVLFVGANANQLPTTDPAFVSAARTSLAGIIERIAVNIWRGGDVPDPATELITVGLVVGAVTVDAIGTMGSTGGDPGEDSFVSAMSQAVAVGEAVRLKLTFPTWATDNPTQLFVTGSVMVRDDAEAAVEASQDAATEAAQLEIDALQAGGGSTLTPGQVASLKEQGLLKPVAGSGLG